MRLSGMISISAAVTLLTATTAGFATDSARQPAARQASGLDGYQRLAAIHPRILDGNTTYDPSGRSMVRAPITRDTPFPPALARLSVSSTQLQVSGVGRAGQTVRLVHNSRVVATATVSAANTWQIRLSQRIAAGDHRFIIESPMSGARLAEVGDEVRVSVPPGHSEPIELEFESEERLRRHAQSIGEDASRIFDSFLGRGRESAPGSEQIAQSSRQPRTADPATASDDIVGQARDWFGRAHDTFQQEVVPRLQLGGGLVLPPPGERVPREAAMQMQRMEFPSVDSVTRSLQAWFGLSADNYDGEILPRLSGATSPAIILPEVPATTERAARRPERQLIDAQEQAERERREAEASRRAAELARRRAEAEQERIAAETSAREQRDELVNRREQEASEQAERERLAAEQAAREQAEAERRRAAEEAERQRAAAEAERQRAAAEAERQRAAEEAERQRQLAEASTERTQTALLPPLPERGALERRSSGQRPAIPTPSGEANETTRDGMGSLWRRAQRFARRATARDTNLPEVSDLQGPPRGRLPAPPVRRPETDQRAIARARLPERRPGGNLGDGGRLPEAPLRSPRRGGSRLAADTGPAPRETFQGTRSGLGGPDRTEYRTRHRTRLAARRKVHGQRVGRRMAAVRSYRRRAASRCRVGSRWRIHLPGRYVVRRGDSLWRIARRHYKRGHRFWRIYRANRRKIRNPNLIYPCQRFYIPRRKHARR
jgi:colicin import membrane protein